MAKIIELFKMEPAAPRTPLVKTLKVNVPDLPVIDSNQLVGIEIELENWEGPVHPVDRVWHSKEDGSLRNDGVEWITSPIAASHAPFALYHLLHEVLSPGSCFSPRTSIHVHVDMQQWEDIQVKHLLLWYLLLEPLFYRFTGRGRQKNIYCVPLMDTDLIRNFYEMPLPHVIAKWSKYTGLNILPLTSFGTIEFRHMHGTFDYVKVSRWIKLICKLCEFVQNHTTEYHKITLSGLTEEINYPMLLGQIFGNDVQYIKFKSLDDLRTTIYQVKLAFTSVKTAYAVSALLDKSSPFFLQAE